MSGLLNLTCGFLLVLGLGIGAGGCCVDSDEATFLQECGNSTVVAPEEPVNRAPRPSGAIPPQLRQQQVGIESYQWLTSQDERVRPTHIRNSGLVFDWGRPPPDTGHLGNDVMCRCTAIPVVTQAARARLTGEGPSSTINPEAGGPRRPPARPSPTGGELPDPDGPDAPEGVQGQAAGHAGD